MINMQETRHQILDILRHQSQFTVDSIVETLRNKYGKNITAVTVRHHLNILQQEGLITEPELRHRTTPGRPQHTYALTEKAHQTFPNNYQQLVASLIEQLQHQLPVESVNVIFEGVADRMASEIINLPGISQNQRLDIVVEYLTQLGYDASWEIADDGFILHTRNCPYHHISRNNEALCSMDLRLITSLVGQIPRRLSRVSDGDTSCAYLIPVKSS